MPLMPTIDTSGIAGAFNALAGVADNIAKRAEGTRIANANAEFLKFEAQTLRDIKMSESNPEKWADLYQEKMDAFASSKANSFGFLDTSEQFKSSVSLFSAKRVQQLYGDADNQLSINADADQSSLMQSADSYEELYTIGKTTAVDGNYYLKQANGGSIEATKLATASKMVTVGSEIFQRQVEKVGFSKAKRDLEDFLKKTSTEDAPVEDRAMANAFRKNIQPVVEAGWNKFSNDNFTRESLKYGNLITSLIVSGKSNEANNMAMAVNKKLEQGEFDSLLNADDKLRLRQSLSNAVSGTREAISSQALSNLAYDLLKNGKDEQARSTILGRYLPLLSGSDVEKAGNLTRQDPLMSQTIVDYSKQAYTAINGAFDLEKLKGSTNPDNFKKMAEAYAILKDCNDKISTLVSSSKFKNMSQKQQQDEVSAIIRGYVAPKIDNSFKTILGQTGKVSDRVGGWGIGTPVTDDVLYRVATGAVSLFPGGGDSGKMKDYTLKAGQAIIEAGLKKIIYRGVDSEGVAKEVKVTAQGFSYGNDENSGKRLLYEIMGVGNDQAQYVEILGKEVNGKKIIYGMLNNLKDGKYIPTGNEINLTGIDWTIDDWGK